MDTSFHHVLFPERFSFGSISGAQFQTDIVQMNSGFERRNSRWHGGRRHYNLTIGPTKLSVIRDVSHFFNARQGRLHGFLYHDWLADSTAKSGANISAFDEPIDAINPERTMFSLYQTYGRDDLGYRRRVSTPRVEGFLLGFNGVRVVDPSLYSVSKATGIVTLNAPVAANVKVTAGFLYHVPVRFDVDQLDIRLISFETASIQSLPLTEIMLSGDD